MPQIELSRFLCGTPETKASMALSQWLSETDGLIMRLLYHPDIKPGMSAHECEAVIRTLYW